MNTNTAMNPINAIAPYSEVSARYGFVPTTSVVGILEGAGWNLRSAQVAGVRKPKEGHADKEGFQKHLLRFQNKGLQSLADSEFELIFVNDHSGSGVARFLAGLFRQACVNGMIIVQEGLADVRVRHVGDAAHNVIEGVWELVDRVPRMVEKVNEFKELGLNSYDSFCYSEEAAKIRWPEHVPILNHDVQSVRRQEDRGNSLWLHYQRAQESLLKGGLSGKTQTGRNMVVRPIRSIDETVRINQELWTLTEKWAANLAA